MASRTVPYYDEISQGYEELYADEQREKIAILLEVCRKRGFVRKDDLLLDVGCGTGLTTRPWPCAWKVGVDPAIRLVERADGACYVNAEAEHLPFADDGFDVVVSVTAIQNFHHTAQGLEEINRVAKRAFILTFLKKSMKASEIERCITSNFIMVERLEHKKDLMFLCLKKVLKQTV